MSEEFFKLDKSAISSVSPGEIKSDREYWLSKTPEERFLACEYLRRLNYGYNPDTERLQRVLTVVKRP